MWHAGTACKFDVSPPRTKISGKESPHTLNNSSPFPFSTDNKMPAVHHKLLLEDALQDSPQVGTFYFLTIKTQLCDLVLQYKQRTWRILLRCSLFPLVGDSSQLPHCYGNAFFCLQSRPGSANNVKLWQCITQVVIVIARHIISLQYLHVAFPLTEWRDADRASQFLDCC